MHFGRPEDVHDVRKGIANIPPLRDCSGQLRRWLQQVGNAVGETLLSAEDDLEVTGRGDLLQNFYGAGILRRDACRC
jgi:hypothetical protein